MFYRAYVVLQYRTVLTVRKNDLPSDATFSYSTGHLCRAEQRLVFVRVLLSPSPVTCSLPSCHLAILPSHSLDLAILPSGFFSMHLLFS